MHSACAQARSLELVGQKRCVQGYLKRQAQAGAQQAQQAAAWLEQLRAQGSAAAARALQYEGLLGACLSCSAIAIRCVTSLHTALQQLGGMASTTKQWQLGKSLGVGSALVGTASRTRAMRSSCPLPP